MHEERRRILDMLAEGTITAEQAEALLRALGEGVPRPPGPERPMPPARAAAHALAMAALEGRQVQRKARSLQIRITKERDDGKHTDVNVTVPLGLVKFASKFIPQHARARLGEHEIDIENLVEMLGSADDIPEGVLLDITAEEDDDTRIIIKAV